MLPGDRVDLLRRLNVDEALNDLQPVVTLEHTLPQVGGCCAIRIDRVACSAVITKVERQEDCVSPRESRGHTYLVRGHSKMDQTARSPLQKWLALRLTVVLVLMNRVIDRLGVVRLQLRSSHREAIDKEDQINRVIGMLGRVVDLTHHPQNVGLVVLLGGGIE